MVKESIEQPFVTVVVPCRNEGNLIAWCLDSIIANDYPKDKLEVLVVDGMSEDDTREIVARYAREHVFIRLLDNRKKHTTAALNIGVKSATGQLVIIMGAHATYDTEYVSMLVRFSQQFDADDVGGVCKIVPRENTLMGKAIAAVIASPFGSGNAYTKISSKEPRWTDTVFGGCYKKEVFERVGLFNEDLSRSQDMEFNLRLRRAGGRILLVPQIECYYYAWSKLKDFSKHNFDDGFWTYRPLKFGKRTFTWRHVVPSLFVLSLIVSGALSLLSGKFLWVVLGILGPYALFNIGSSVHVSMVEKNFRLVPLLPLVFFSRHVSYGLGALVGLVALLLPSRPKVRIQAQE